MFILNCVNISKKLYSYKILSRLTVFGYTKNTSRLKPQAKTRTDFCHSKIYLRSVGKLFTAHRRLNLFLKGFYALYRIVYYITLFGIVKRFKNICLLILNFSLYNLDIAK